MTRSSLQAGALLPLRLFLGVTFLYAGLDKLLDPAFFDPSAATSLHAQLTAFARLSPLGELIRASLPLATPIGLGIAIGEIGVGIGALTGLAYRVAVAGGLALSVLFWLSASWATHPYYLGPDLPYALGWLTLGLAGRRDLASAGENEPPVSPERRLFLQVGTLAAIAAAAASLTLPLRALGLHTGSLPAPSPAPSVGPAPTPNAVSMPIAKLDEVRRAGAAVFTVPFDAPAPFPAGDPGVLVLLADGSIVAFDAVCTHAGCTVEFDRADALLVCPCHGATFDPADDAAVLDGPTAQPLAALPIGIDPVTGTISLLG